MNIDWSIIIFVATVIFQAGMNIATLRNKPSKEEVDEMIEEKFNNHCPFTEKIEDLERVGREDYEYKNRLAKELLKENESHHLTLQRVELNLINVCKKIGLDYIKA